MGKLQDSFSGMKGFFSDVGAEMGKITWPERQELLGSTVVVIVSVVLLSMYVGVCDKLLVTLLKVLVRQG
jgi:preprotein translocase subunit SecE